MTPAGLNAAVSGASIKIHSLSRINYLKKNKFHLLYLINFHLPYLINLANTLRKVT